MESTAKKTRGERKVVVFNLISLRKHHVVEFMKKVRASTSHSLVVLAGSGEERRGERDAAFTSE